jgi:GNAT superfamily N-acetyltransferase
MVELRAIRADEWDEALGLWEEVFGVGQWLFDSLHQSTTDRSWEHARVAVEDGRIVAAADVFLRHVRDEDGVPQLMGGIGSVATRPEARRKGYSRALLNQIIERMAIDGCKWSMLFTGSFDHYAPLGWKRIALPGADAQLKNQEFTTDSTVVRLGDPWPFTEMGQLYDSFNGQRPLTGIRTDPIWSIAIKVRLEQPERFCLGRVVDRSLKGYLVATKGNRGFDLEEMAVQPGDTETVSVLLQGFAPLIKEDGMDKFSSQLPTDPTLDGPLAEISERLDRVGSPWTMVRPVDPSWTDARLDALFKKPEAVFYSLDKF